jgi:hypothetical protein
MRKKLYSKDIYDYFQEQGCELLEEYKHYHFSMKYKCFWGNISKIS